jgi:cytochrome c
MTSRRLAAVLLVAMLASVPPAHAAGAERGQQVFAVECSDCHSVAEGKNKRGPSLFGVYGRRAATAPGFSNYSDALRCATAASCGTPLRSKGISPIRGRWCRVAR